MWAKDTHKECTQGNCYLMSPLFTETFFYCFILCGTFQSRIKTPDTSVRPQNVCIICHLFCEYFFYSLTFRIKNDIISDVTGYLLIHSLILSTCFILVTVLVNLNLIPGKLRAKWEARHEYRTQCKNVKQN